MAILVEFLLLRLRYGRIAISRSILVSAISSGLTSLAIWTWQAQIEWGWKMEDSTEPMWIKIAFFSIAAVEWSAFGVLPAAIMAWIYPKLFSPK